MFSLLLIIFTHQPQATSWEFWGKCAVLETMVPGCSEIFHFCILSTMTHASCLIIRCAYLLYFPSLPVSATFAYRCFLCENYLSPVWWSQGPGKEALQFILRKISFYPTVSISCFCLSKSSERSITKSY